ncbi:MAG: hypothetical protein H7223_12355 [Pedobacter sp.]|nr:hypothetical protein [Pedobacter sp.]
MLNETLEIAIMKTFRNLFSVLLILSAGISRADDPGLPGGDPDVPIDGGVVILLVAGVYYGVQKIRGTKEEGSESS